MSNLNLLIAAGIIIIVIGFIEVVIPILKKKNINVPVILNEVETGLEEAGTAIKAGQELVPSSALNILSIVDNLAIRATKSAQQLAISAQLPLDKRKTIAKASILAGLKAFKIPVSEELDMVIDDSIQQFVLDSKTPEEQRSQQQNVLQTTVKTLQTQLTQSTADKEQLQQKVTALTNQISTIQATVTTK